MLNCRSYSTNYAKNALILGHTSSGMGEKTLALKFKRAMQRAGYGVEPIIDILDLLGEDFEPLAQMNYALADAGFALVEEVKEPPPIQSSDLMVILSWCFGAAAIFATGIHKKCSTAVMLHAHHPNERILTQLYAPADLIFTEALLANERGLNYGMDPAKLLYLPPCYPVECENISASRTYVEDLAKSQGKTLDKGAKIIGCVSRLEYGKNCEFAVEAVRRLALKKHNVVLVLKGDFPESSHSPAYKPNFLEMLCAYREEPWLLWDPHPTPYPQVLEHYANFDLLLHPSGAEGASLVVIECLGLKKPVVLLDCSTNPYLFKGVATFVKTQGEIRPAPLPFYVPDLENLCQILEGELHEPDGTKVEERFHEQALIERIPLLFEPDAKTIKKLYTQDRKKYELEIGGK